MRRLMRRLHVTLFRNKSRLWAHVRGLAATTESRNQPRRRKNLCEKEVIAVPRSQARSGALYGGAATSILAETTMEKGHDLDAG